MWLDAVVHSPNCNFNALSQPTLLLIINTISYVEATRFGNETIPYEHIRPGVIHIKDSMADILQESWQKVDALEHIRQWNVNYVNFEVGYLIHVIQNKYRKMLDRYYSAVLMGPKPLFLFDLIILLEEVEHGYFQIDHLERGSAVHLFPLEIMTRTMVSSERVSTSKPFFLQVKMLSQVEAKYGIFTPINVQFKELSKLDEIREQEKRSVEQESGILSGGFAAFMNSEGLGGFGGSGGFDGGGGNMFHGHSQTSLPMPPVNQGPRKKPFNWTAYREQMEYVKKAMEYYKKFSKEPHTRWWWPMDYGWEIDKVWGWW